MNQNTRGLIKKYKTLFLETTRIRAESYSHFQILIGEWIARRIDRIVLSALWSPNFPFLHMSSVPIRAGWTKGRHKDSSRGSQLKTIKACLYIFIYFLYFITIQSHTRLVHQMNSPNCVNSARKCVLYSTIFNLFIF